MYEKLLLQKGDILSDFHINHIEEGISQIDRDIDGFKSTVVKILKAKGIPASTSEDLNSLSQKVNYLNGGYIPNDSDSDEYMEEIDIRKTVQSGQIQLLFSDVQSGYAEIAVYTTDGSQYSVDWGDGTSDICNSGAVVKHQYIAGIGGSPYRESNTQWVATISCENNVIYRFRQLNNSDIIWFCAKDVYFEYMYSMFSGGDTSVHAPKAMKYFDLIGGSLGCQREPSCAYTFRSCDSLERISGTINLLGASSVVQLFYGCKKLKELPPVLNLSTVSQAGYLFCNCESLTSIPDLVSTSSITAANYMFKNCKKLTELPRLNLENLLSAVEFAAYCDSLEDIRKISNTGSITDAASMFRDCISLKYTPSTMDFGSTLNASYLFYNCNALIDAPSTIYLGSAVHINRMFMNCKSMRTAPTSIIAPNAQSAQEIFNGCTSLRYAPSTMVLPKAQNVYSMFINCKSLQAAPEVLEFEEALEAYDIFNACDMLETPPREIIMPKAIQAHNMFVNCYSLKSTPERINLDSAQKVYNMFSGCRLLDEVLIEELNFPQAVYIYSLFYNCRSLTKAPKIIAPKAQDAYNVFYLCEQLVQSHDIDLPAAMNIESFYRECRALEHAPAINAPIATRWGSVYRDNPILQSITSMPGSSTQNIDYLINNTPKIMNIGNVIDLTNVSSAASWISTNDPTYIQGPITIKGCKTSFYLRNCRNLTSIRFENMDPLCGNLNFSNCAMEVEDINLLLGDLVETVIPATITLTGNPGARSCDMSIATSKGWTVTV